MIGNTKMVNEKYIEFTQTINDSGLERDYLNSKEI